MGSKYLAARESSSSAGDAIIHSSVISTHEYKRKRGEPMLVERVIFFDGMVYQIEEEVYSDSDHSSVYTSEDSFEIDEDLQNQFKSINPLFDDKTESFKKSL